MGRIRLVRGGGAAPIRVRSATPLSENPAGDDAEEKVSIALLELNGLGHLLRNDGDDDAVCSAVKNVKKKKHAGLSKRLRGLGGNEDRNDSKSSASSASVAPAAKVVVSIGEQSVVFKKASSGRGEPGKYIKSYPLQEESMDDEGNVLSWGCTWPSASAEDMSKSNLLDVSSFVQGDTNGAVVSLCIGLQFAGQDAAHPLGVATVRIPDKKEEDNSPLGMMDDLVIPVEPWKDRKLRGKKVDRETVYAVAPSTVIKLEIIRRPSSQRIFDSLVNDAHSSFSTMKKSERDASSVGTEAMSTASESSSAQQRSKRTTKTSRTVKITNIKKDTGDHLSACPPVNLDAKFSRSVSPVSYKDSSDDEESFSAASVVSVLAGDFAKDRTADVGTAQVTSLSKKDESLCEEFATELADVIVTQNEIPAEETDVAVAQMDGGSPGDENDCAMNEEGAGEDSDLTGVKSEGLAWKENMNMNQHQQSHFDDLTQETHEEEDSFISLCSWQGKKHEEEDSFTTVKELNFPDNEAEQLRQQLMEQDEPYDEGLMRITCYEITSCVANLGEAYEAAKLGFEDIAKCGIVSDEMFGDEDDDMTCRTGCTMGTYESSSTPVVSVKILNTPEEVEEVEEIEEMEEEGTFEVHRLPPLTNDNGGGQPTANETPRKMAGLEVHSESSVHNGMKEKHASRWWRRRNGVAAEKKPTGNWSSSMSIRSNKSGKSNKSCQSGASWKSAKSGKSTKSLPTPEERKMIASQMFDCEDVSVYSV